MLNRSTETDSAYQQSWNFSPLSKLQLGIIIGILTVYSLIYLIYAQHHLIVLYIMTGLIFALMSLLYTSGILAVTYMLIKMDKLEKEVENCTITKIAINDAEIKVVDK
ncbi:unnamed protein product [Thelazia callipaeda]|uniref:DUF485 domain-containing protein n=1 Tax=Thelazia callipaeda TaxID=103827 RepID=A0A0N5D5C1_THECL|nr:unnamed protein product [Thelazia callipaeda]